MWSSLQRWRETSECGPEKLKNMKFWDMCDAIRGTYINIYIYIYTYTHTHTYIHIQLELQKKKERECDGTIFENIMAVGFSNWGQTAIYRWRINSKKSQAEYILGSPYLYNEGTEHHWQWKDLNSRSHF